MNLDSQAAFFDTFIASGRISGRFAELPAGTVAAYRIDPITGQPDAYKQNDQPATQAQPLTLTGGVTLIAGVLKTDGLNGIVTTGWLTGTDASKPFDVFFTLQDAGPGTGNTSLAVFSVSAENSADCYAKVTLGSGVTGERPLTLYAFDKNAPGGLATAMPSTVGTKGVHLFRLRIASFARTLTLLHIGSGETASVTLPSYGWAQRLCLASGGAYRGLSGPLSGRTILGAEKFAEVGTVGMALVARHTLDTEILDTAAVLMGLALAPRVLKTVVGGSATTLKVTLRDATSAVSWTLVGPGTLSAKTGREITYTPPGTVQNDTSAIITATGEGFSADTEVAIAAGLRPETPPASGAVIYNRDVNFNSSQLSPKYRDFYEKGFAAVRRTLATGTKYNGTSTAFDWADRYANAFGRPTTMIYNMVCSMYMETRDPELLGYLADRLELVTNGMRSLAGKSPGPEYMPDGKSSWLTSIESKPWYDNPVTLTDLDGSTFSISWKSKPKLVYSRPVSAANPVGREKSGTDEPHDFIPRISALSLIAMILDQNRDYNRGTGKESVGSLADFWWHWLRKEMRFFKYRSTSGGSTGLYGVGRDNKGVVDWGEYFTHDFWQAHQLDFVNWEWSKLREGESSRRTLYWKAAYEARQGVIKRSMPLVRAPDGYDVTYSGHHLSAALNELGGASERAAYDYENQWVVGYCSDAYPAAMVMAYCGAPGAREYAQAWANAFTQIIWISETRIAPGACGPLNTFSDGSPLTYPASWPTGMKLNSSSTVFNYGSAAGSYSVASVNHRFSDVQGYNCIVFDPTPSKQNVSFYQKMAARWGGYTSAKGAVDTTRTDFDFANMQCMDFLIGKKLNVDPRTL